MKSTDFLLAAVSQLTRYGMRLASIGSGSAVGNMGNAVELDKPFCESGIL